MFALTLAGGVVFLAAGTLCPGFADWIGCGGQTFYAMNLAELVVSCAAVRAEEVAEYEKVLVLQLVYKFTWCGLALLAVARGGGWDAWRVLGFAVMFTYVLGDSWVLHQRAAAARRGDGGPKGAGGAVLGRVEKGRKGGARG